jgi:hypothetical protein
LTLVEGIDEVGDCAAAAIGSRRTQSPIANRQSPIANRQSQSTTANPNRRSAISIVNRRWQSSIGSAAIGTRQSAVDNRRNFVSLHPAF